MRSTPEQDARLRIRLQEAVDRFSAGNAEAFAKAIGFGNGGYIRMCLRADNPRPVRESIIERVNSREEMRGWFDDVLTPVSAADVRAVARSKQQPWPFRRLTPKEWEEIDEFDRAVAESAYLDALDRSRARGVSAVPMDQRRKRTAQPA